MPRLNHNEVIINNRFIAICAVLTWLPEGLFFGLALVAFTLSLKPTVNGSPAQELAKYNWIFLGIESMYLLPTLILFFFIKWKPRDDGKGKAVDFANIQTLIEDPSMLSLLRLLFCSLLVLINSWNIVIINWINGTTNLFQLMNSIFTTSMIYWYIPGLIVFCATGVVDDLMLWSGLITRITN